MRILELFKGTGSITNFFKNDTDVEVISLDILSKYNPTYCCDIMDFDYKQYEIGYFDYIWASPECKVFSKLQFTHIGRKWKNKEELEQAQIDNKIFINKTIEIIDYLKPNHYFIENPLNSAIWNHIDNKNYIDDFVIVDYCYFGTKYKKPTKILTNKILDNKRCSCKTHKFRIGINDLKQFNKDQSGDETNTDQRYSIPVKLIDYLFTNT